MIRAQVLKHLPGGRERCRRVGMPGSLKGRRSEPRMKRFLEEGRMEEEKESVLPSVGEERIGKCTH